MIGKIPSETKGKSSRLSAYGMAVDVFHFHDVSVGFDARQHEPVSPKLPVLAEYGPQVPLRQRTCCGI
jgi:hypothetical protein